MKTKTSQNAHRGSDFRDFLGGEGILPQVEVLALKRVVSLQLQQILEHDHVTKTELAARMNTSRASLDRMLDPSNPSLTGQPRKSRRRSRAEGGTTLRACLMLIRELRPLSW